MKWIIIDVHLILVPEFQFLGNMFAVLHRNVIRKFGIPKEICHAKPDYDYDQATPRLSWVCLQMGDTTK